MSGVPPRALAELAQQAYDSAFRAHRLIAELAGLFREVADALDQVAGPERTIDIRRRLEEIVASAIEDASKMSADLLVAGMQAGVSGGRDVV